MAGLAIRLTYLSVIVDFVASFLGRWLQLFDEDYDKDRDKEGSGRHDMTEFIWCGTPHPTFN